METGRAAASSAASTTFLKYASLMLLSIRLL